MTICGYITHDNLERIVSEKLASLGITDEDYPINPYKLIQREGIVLSENSFENPNIKGMLVHGPNCSGIIINQNRTFASKRFIAMHELFHYWFHPKADRTICLDEYIDKNKAFEWQANNGASIALMPKQIVYDLFEYSNGDTDYISSYLQVSPESLQYRMNELNLKCQKQLMYFFNRETQDKDFLRAESRWLYSDI